MPRCVVIMIVVVVVVKTATRTRLLRQCKRLPRPKSKPKVIWDLNLDFWINLDPDWMSV